jgi:hypothetical protein
MEDIKRVADDYMRREEKAVANLKKAIDLGKSLETKVKEKKDKVHDLKAKLERADQVNIEQADHLKLAEDRAVALQELLEELQREREEKEKRLTAEIQGIRDDMALTRFTTRAAIMRRYLRGKNPLAEAQVELDFYLSHVGSVEDLDADDELDAEEEGLEKEKTEEQVKEGDRVMEEPKGVGEGASKEKASGSNVLEAEVEGETVKDAGEEEVAVEEEAWQLTGPDAPIS